MSQTEEIKSVPVEEATTSAVPVQPVEVENEAADQKQDSVPNDAANVAEVAEESNKPEINQEEKEEAKVENESKPVEVCNAQTSDAEVPKDAEEDSARLSKKRTHEEANPAGENAVEEPETKRRKLSDQEAANDATVE